MEAASPLAAAPPSEAQTRRMSTLYSKRRSFKIPFNIDEADKKRLREVQLWVSDDSGAHWEARSKATLDQPASFPFRAARDGEYLFAVRTIDLNGRKLPEGGEVEPSLKVVVDTVPPSLIIEQDGRRGSMASVHWEVRDENLNLNSLTIEYQQEGGRTWRQVPVHRLSKIGSVDFDAGTAEQLRVRARVEDKAENRTESIINLDEGTPSRPAHYAGDVPEFSEPPPISRISSGPNFTPVEESEREPEPRDPFPPRRSQGNRRPRSPAAADPAEFQGEATQSAPPSQGANGEQPPTGAPRTLHVPSPKFPLKYDVDDAGQNGPASVELWVTQDGGRSWNRQGEDPDRLSPFEVDLGSEGTFGLCLVARALSGLGDQPPAAGDHPQVWVEVDSTPPAVKLATPQIGTGNYVGKVAISWAANDLHLVPKPVTLSWRADQPNAPWQHIAGPIENTGRFIWTVPVNTPPKIHIRVEAVDTAGNKGAADTAEIGPVIVDRTRPRGRIIGLDDGTRTGQGSTFRTPIR